MKIICGFCGEIESPKGHVCASGRFATIKLSRDLYDLWKLRMEQIGLALGEMSPGDEPTKGQYVSWFEKSLTLLDVPCTTIRRWFDSGERRVTGATASKTER